jgi:hypothetical protein
VGGLFFQGRIVPTEVQKPSELSGKNLMGRGKLVSRNFYILNTFVFNNLSNMSIFLTK